VLLSLLVAFLFSFSTADVLCHLRCRSREAVVDVSIKGTYVPRKWNVRGAHYHGMAVVVNHITNFILLTVTYNFISRSYHSYNADSSSSDLCFRYPEHANPRKQEPGHAV